MSALVPVMQGEMLDGTVIRSMMRRRLHDYIELNGWIYGYLDQGNYQTRVAYNIARNELGADGDRGKSNIERLKSFYLFEKARLEAESCGGVYTETVDPSTGQVISAEVDIPDSAVQQLASEVC